MCKFESQSSAEFVALELILDWDRFDGNIKNQPSPLFKPKMHKVAVSVLPHRKCMNLFQVMFVKLTEAE